LLIDKSKSKLGEELEFLPEVLLETHSDFVKLTKDNYPEPESLISLKFSLEEKLSEEEIENICQKQREIIKLSESKDFLKEFQTKKSFLNINDQNQLKGNETDLSL
jgi:hypothetical protein